MILTILLGVVALLGHGYWLMLSLNFTYAHPFHRMVLKAQRQIWGILLVGTPVIVLLCMDFDLKSAFSFAAIETPRLLLHIYLAICLAFGAFFVFFTIRRLVHKPPGIIRSERSELIDIAALLGHRPAGNGKHRFLANARWNDLYRVEFTDLELGIPGLPNEWDGLSILHLSDLHFYGSPDREYFETIVQKITHRPTPDLLVISGDILDGPEYLNWISPVLEPLRWKIAALAILGNHDWWQDSQSVRMKLTSLGMQVLGNGWQTIEVRGQTLVAIGHEGPWFRPPPDLSTCPSGFRLLISHTPDNIRWAQRHECRLMLSGHNHGGQIRVPLLGSLFVPSKFSRRYDMGTFHEEPTVLHVNRGLSGKEPIRIRCHPQVSRLVLRPQTLTQPVRTGS